MLHDPLNELCGSRLDILSPPTRSSLAWLASGFLLLLQSCATAVQGHFTIHPHPHRKLHSIKATLETGSEKEAAAWNGRAGAHLAKPNSEERFPTSLCELLGNIFLQNSFSELFHLKFPQFPMINLIKCLHIYKRFNYHALQSLELRKIHIFMF